MNLIPIDWSEAQAILLKLVQTLTPWTGKEVPTSFFLSKRFSFPSDLAEGTPHLRSSVKLLTTLRNARELVDEWVPDSSDAPRPESPEGKASQPEGKKIHPVPFAKQAERMIHEVQEAIGTMVYSAQLKDPKEEPLRLALKRLKPHLDELIEAVANEGMHSADDRPAPFRFPLAVPHREHLLRRIAQRGEKLGWEVGEGRGTPNEREVETKVLTPRHRQEGIVEKRGEREKELPRSRAPQTPPESTLESHPKTVEGTDPMKMQLHEKTVLPAAPFIPQIKNPISSVKKKKKRKGFWFKGDDSEEVER